MKDLIKKLQELFDYKDGTLYRKISVQGAPSGVKASHVGNKNHYEYINVNRKKIRTHRAIYMMHHGYCPDAIDHIDGDKRNNKIENLRDATKSQNQMNRGKYNNNKSGVKNVHWNKLLSKWTVKLNVNKKRIHVGHFDDLEFAELVALEARNKFHGNFAHH